MDTWAQMVITIVCSVIASSGFWAYLQRSIEKKDVKTDMLKGLAHDRIMELSICYITRGWIAQEEYENLHKYLYTPYSKMGGNGTAVRRNMNDVDKLPIKKLNYNFIKTDN